MTLRQLLAAHPDRFYAQTWYTDEQFLDLTPRALDWPARLASGWWAHGEATAADLAALYLADPTRPMWQHYLWTCDHDALGQRVYVGDNGHGLEIHRHLALTDRWRTPQWA